MGEYGYQGMQDVMFTAADLARNPVAQAKYIQYADALRDRCRARYCATWEPPPPQRRKGGVQYVFAVTPRLICADSLVMPLYRTPLSEILTAIPNLQEWAQEKGIDYSYVRRIKSGIRQPGRVWKVQLAKALGMRVNQIIWREDNAA